MQQTTEETNVEWERRHVKCCTKSEEESNLKSIQTVCQYERTRTAGPKTRQSIRA